MAKKRKETTQSSTLDRFFNNKGATPGSNKKAKVQTTPAPAKGKVTKPTFRVSPDEIIVIDSDDEHQETLVVDDSSDIEVLQDGPSNPSSSNTRSTKARTAHLDRDGLYNDTHDVFGEPSLLTEGRPKRTGMFEDGIEDADFGMPTLLSAGIEDASVATKDDPLEFEDISNNQPHLPSPHPLHRTESSGGASYVDNDPMNAGLSEEVWELGDDERDEANIEEIITDNIDDAVQTCPICNTLLNKAMTQLVSRATCHTRICVLTISSGYRGAR